MKTKYGNIFQNWLLNSNPFAVEALKADEKGERLLRGRDEDIEDVVYKLHRSGKITCIDGHFGIGKTSLVNVAAYKCLQAFREEETTDLIIPNKTTFQLKEEIDVDEFANTVLHHVILTLKEYEELIYPRCRVAGFHDFKDQINKLHRLISQPIVTLESKEGGGGATAGVPGVLSFTAQAKGSSSEQLNNTAGFNLVGFESNVKILLEKTFTSISGGVVCIIDNIELLETATKARKTLELLRDRLFSTPGLRWVFCGANGVINSLAASPRLSAYLNIPVIDLKYVHPRDLSDLIFARIEEYSTKPQQTLESLPFDMDQIEWLYEILNFNLRDLFALLEQYCEKVARNKAQVTKSQKAQRFNKWVEDYGRQLFIDISKRISKDTWSVLDTAMSDEFNGVINAGQFREYYSNITIGNVTKDTFRKWLKNLKKHDILSQSIPDESGVDNSEIELETYYVTSKGALVFYYRQKTDEYLTLLKCDDWLKRTNR